MEFYEEHMERLYLREWIRLYSPRVVLGFVVWFLFKIRLARTKPIISSVKGDLRERLIELDQIPEQTRPEIITIMDQLAEQGFVEPLLESYLQGRNRDHLKMIGVRVLARHKSGRYVASEGIVFGEESSPQHGGHVIYTFINAEKTITTCVGSPRIGETPGNSLTYYPESTIEEILEHHRQAIAQRGDSYISILNQDEMLDYAQGLQDRFVNHMVERGYLVKVDPEEGPELPAVIDYENKNVVTETGSSRLVRFLIGFLAFLIIFLLTLYKRGVWGQ